MGTGKLLPSYPCPTSSHVLLHLGSCPCPPYPLLGAICHTPAALFPAFALAQLRLPDLHGNSAKSQQTGKENKLIQCSEGFVFSDHAEALKVACPASLSVQGCLL